MQPFKQFELALRRLPYGFPVNRGRAGGNRVDANAANGFGECRVVGFPVLVR